MAKKGILVLALSLLLSPQGFAEWIRLSTQPPFLSELVSMENAADNQIWIASEESIYQKENHQWKTLWTHSHHNGIIHQIRSFKNLPHQLFVLTDEGLYVGHSLTRTWTRVFHGTNYPENNILSFSVHPTLSHFWLIGTSAGLFQSLDAGKTWKHIWQMKKNPVSLIGFLENNLFLATDHDLYTTQNLIDFKHLLSLNISNETQEEVNLEKEFLEISETTLFKEIIIQSPYLWILTRQGLYESQDKGLSWKKQVPPHVGPIFDILYSETHLALFISTQNALYRYQPQKETWTLVSTTIPHEGFREISVSSQSLMGLSEAAIYKLPVIDIFSSPENISFDLSKKTSLERLFRFEPSVRDIHAQVIAYNDTDNRKIKSWHIASRLKHLLPSFSFGRDFSRSNNIDLDRGSTSVADTYIAGPDDLNRGWDMSVSWDLADLIWTSSQTSIDIRSKSMVELRQDLLSEATRIFYERRRIQTQLALTKFSSPENFFEKQIRHDELSALLDSLTGGWFSEKIKNVYLEHPELRSLWSAPDLGEVDHTRHQSHDLLSDAQRL